MHFFSCLAKAGLFVFAVRSWRFLPLARPASPDALSHKGRGNGLSMKAKSKAAAEIKALARKHSKAAIKVLASIMNQADGPATARVSAAQALLDRGWGKAAQPIAGEEGGLAVIARIERVIVDSQKANGKKHSSGEDGRPHTSD